MKFLKRQVLLGLRPNITEPPTPLVISNTDIQRHVKTYLIKMPRYAGTK